jgi:LysR family hydrogen peroxide-inducible transcriptional activator
MNLQQLEYIVNLDQERHFVRAAEKSFITQPTLSMMINKLEDELGFRIFDRSKHPVEPTKDGAVIIEMARKVVLETKRIKNYSQELLREFGGDVSLGIIPTLAPFTLPLVLKSLTIELPDTNWHFKENFTHDIINQIVNGSLDFGLLAGPVNKDGIIEVPLFNEPFYVYLSQEISSTLTHSFNFSQLNENERIWILEDGHCMRHQMLNICNLKQSAAHNIHYEAGSIQSLVNLVDALGGMTIIPALSVDHLSEKQKLQVRSFENPVPARKISLIMHQHYPRKKLASKITECIKLLFVKQFSQFETHLLDIN